MRSRSLLILVTVLALAACRTTQRYGVGREGGRVVTAVDSGGRPISALESGSSLEMMAEGLAPRALYEFDVTLDGRQISFARAATDSRGRVPPFVLWYQSGVVGCATREADRFRPIQFRTFDEAEQALRGKTLRVTARDVKQRDSREAPPIAFDLPLAPRRAPMVYPSNAGGCLMNSIETESEDLFVSGRNFEPNEVLSVSVVPNQRAWYTGDLAIDVTGASAAAAPKRVTADANGRFTVRAWEANAQRRGVYDLVVQRLGRRNTDLAHIDLSDIISYGSDSAVILYLIYPPGGPNQDLAGRPISGSPYFEFADSFADMNDNVWAAVDPTYIPPGHAGGIYAGYHVVAHRSVAGWDPMMGGSQAIADISTNGVEVMPVKAGCINATDTIIWPANVAAGDYDVVVDFGSMPANNAGAYMPDGQYDPPLDFLDGAVQIGFKSARDPYELGPALIGTASYSVDNFFPSVGGASNVDLRAVVRYPATAAGANMPITAGTHPLFVIEHGNHWMCRVCTDNSLWYDRYKQAILSGNFTTFNNLCTYTHVTCPDRTQNHQGYTRLLEILASHGIIAVSIDAYDLTGPVPSWINERADLILKHLEMWAHLNNAAMFPAYPDPFAGLFSGHVDMTKISVSGHSRGGEASVVAYLRNQMLPTPFSINSVSSIAPVDNLSSVLPAVPYFVIAPAADGDVSDMSGIHIYDRAGSAISDATTKSAIYVYGANHNFFNTIWAADFDDYADDQPGWPVRADFIPAADQQRLGDAYLAAFHLIHLNGETVYEDMLRGGLTFPSTAGRRIYHSRHETSHAKLEAGSGANGAPSAGAVETPVVNPSVHRTSAVRLGWPSNTAVYTYTVPLAQRDTTGFEVLSFRVAQTTAASNPMSGDQNFIIELMGGGNVRGVFAGQFDAIPRPYSRPDLVHTVMSTVRLPLHSFIINNSGVTLNNIDTIRFRFTNPGTGEIYVDDVEFSR